MQQDFSRLLANDPEGFKSTFLREIYALPVAWFSSAKPYEVDVSQPASRVAAMIVAADGDWQKMGASLGREHLHMDQLMSLLRNHTTRKSDALVIFSALLKGEAEFDNHRCAPLVHEALVHPAWRIDAIELHPWAFRRVRFPVAMKTAAWNTALYNFMNSMDSCHDLKSGTVDDVLDTLAALSRANVPDLVDELGRGPTFMAFRTGNRSLALALMQLHGTRIIDDVRDDDGNAPLHDAADPRGLVTVSGGIAAWAKFLLSLGADPRVRNKAGKTPLELAACRGHVKVVAALLACGVYEESDLASARCVTSNRQCCAMIDAHRARRAIETLSEASVAPMPL